MGWLHCFRKNIRIKVKEDIKFNLNGKLHFATKYINKNKYYGQPCLIYLTLQSLIKKRPVPWTKACDTFLQNINFKYNWFWWSNFFKWNKPIIIKLWCSTNSQITLKFVIVS